LQWKKEILPFVSFFNCNFRVLFFEYFPDHVVGTCQTCYWHYCLSLLTVLQLYVFPWTVICSCFSVQCSSVHNSLLSSYSDRSELTNHRVIPPLVVLQGLYCGSTYHLFLTAQNKIGSSSPSPTLSVKTQGRAPGTPEPQTLLSPNSTSVLLRLHVWPDNGCPLTYFVLQYRPINNQHWTLGMPSK
jgi:hypothetical protein